MEVVHSFDARRIADLVELYRGEWWCRTRTESDVRRLLAGPSVPFGVVDSGDLVGFARLLSDGVYKALVFDVIVAAQRRGEGIARLLMEAVLRHPSVRGVEHVELYCRPEHVPLYEKWGFSRLAPDLCFMRRESAMDDPAVP